MVKMKKIEFLYSITTMYNISFPVRMRYCVEIDKVKLQGNTNQTSFFSKDSIFTIALNRIQI